MVKPEGMVDVQVSRLKDSMLKVSAEKVRDSKFQTMNGKA